MAKAVKGSPGTKKPENKSPTIIKEATSTGFENPNKYISEPSVEVKQNFLGFNDRVSVSLGQKIMVRDYEPVDIQLHYSTDVREGQKRDEVIADAIKFVKASIKPLILDTEKARKEFQKLKKG